jgi:hypothetical protein
MPDGVNTLSRAQAWLVYRQTVKHKEHIHAGELAGTPPPIPTADSNPIKVHVNWLIDEVQTIICRCDETVPLATEEHVFCDRPVSGFRSPPPRSLNTGRRDWATRSSGNGCQHFVAVPGKTRFVVKKGRVYVAKR